MMPDNEVQILRNPSPDDRAGRLPDFILIGAMKSGTTSLFQLFRRHPQILMCTPKEPQFFSRDHVYARGEQWYRSLFADAAEDQICGEASTCYSRWPHYSDAAARIAQTIPDVKLIYLMRHPVERAYSHYRHRMTQRAMHGECILPFDEALSAIPEIVDASLYMMQIEVYLAHFPQEQFLFLLLEDLSAAPAQAIAQVQRFLGLDPTPSEFSVGTVANEAGSMFARTSMWRLTERIRHAPVVPLLISAFPQNMRRGLRELLMRPEIAQTVFAWKTRRHESRLSELTPRIRKRLLDQFAGATRQLETFLERRLPKWYV